MSLFPVFALVVSKNICQGEAVVCDSHASRVTIRPLEREQRIGAKERTLKALSILIIGMFVLLAACNKRASIAPKTNPDASIFFNDIGNQNAGFSFANAFATEPSCSGLSLMTWEGHTNAQRLEGMKARWWLSFYRLREDEYSVSLDRDQNLTGSFIADSAKESARRVCLIVKGKGGKVR